MNLSFAVCLLLLNFIWNFIFSYNINNVCEYLPVHILPLEMMFLSWLQFLTSVSK